MPAQNYNEILEASETPDREVPEDSSEVDDEVVVDCSEAGSSVASQRGSARERERA